MSDKVEIVGRVAKLDGRSSEDPDGSLLTYLWRLRSAPDDSDGTLAFDDATTPATDTLSDTAITTALVTVGDYLLFEGTSYEILTVVAGTVTVDGTPFTAAAADVVARIFRSSYILHNDEAIATIDVDVLGQFLVQLEVYDGLTWSDPIDILIDGREWDSIIGESIGGDYMWRYLSDLYSIVNEKDYATEFFACATQIAGNTYLRAAQAETGVSLANIQPYVHYRWLDMLQDVAETDLEGQTYTPAYGVVAYQSVAPTPLPVPGDDLQIRLYVGEDSYEDITYTFQGPIGSMNDAINELNAYYVGLGYSVQFSRIEHNSLDFFTLRSDNAFEIIGGTAATGANSAMFRVGQTNWMYGAEGEKLDRSLYKIKDDPTSGKERGRYIDFALAGHFLVIHGESYKILEVISDNTDTLPNQRVNVGRDLPDLNPVTELSIWAIPGFFESTDLSWEEELVFNADVAYLTLAVGQEEDAETIRIVGVHEKKVGVLTSFPANPYYDRVVLEKVKRYSYHPLDEAIERIPRLQELIDEPDPILEENVNYLVDYYRGRRCIAYDYFYYRNFITGGGTGSPIVPISIEDDIADRMWAEHVIVSNTALVDTNFGAQVYFDSETYSDLDEVQYLSSVRGLWYIYSRGKTIENLRKGLYIFFALPFAEQPGTIEQISYASDSPYGRLFIRDDGEDGELRTYLFKTALGLGVNPITGGTFAVGDHVEQFTPLTEGVDVEDWVSDPRWFAGMLGTAHFMDSDFYEIQKFHRFLVEIDSQAYSLEYKEAAQAFVDEWRPRYLLPIFVILHRVEDEIVLEDNLLFDIEMQLIDTFCPVTPYLLDVGLYLDSPGDPWPGPGPDPWLLDSAQFCPSDIISILVEWTTAWPPPTWLGTYTEITGAPTAYPPAVKPAFLDVPLFYLDPDPDVAYGQPPAIPPPPALDGQEKGVFWFLDDTQWALPPPATWITIYPW